MIHIIDFTWWDRAFVVVVVVLSFLFDGRICFQGIKIKELHEV